MTPEQESQKVNNGSLSQFIGHIHPRRLPPGVIGLRPTFCLGGLSALFFLVLLLTGVLLMFFYTPGATATQSASLVTIQEVAAYGWLVRGMHKWAGQAMVATVFLHMLRVVLSGAYRPPREGNWVIGVGLLGLTVLLDFSGYLLVGDATSLLAQQVVSGILRELPSGGNLLLRAFLGGEAGGELAGLRIYAWHCMGLPLAAASMMGWHFYRVRRDGGVKAPL